LRTGSRSNVTRAISWDDTKLGSPALAISWDDTKRKQLLGAALGALCTLFLLASPAPIVSAHAAGAPNASLIVRLQPDAGSGPARFIRSSGGHIDRQLDIIDGIVASVPQQSVAALRALPGVASVTVNQALDLHGTTYDPTVDPNSMASTKQAIGAGSLNSQGVTGKGVDVALVDTGVAPVAGLTNVVNAADFSFDTNSANVKYVDGHGHGSFMAGIIAGNAADYQGVAPGARIINVKAANASGVTDVSLVIEGIGWVVKHKNDNGMNIRVLNLSFGTEQYQDYSLDPLAYAAEIAWLKGIVVVVSGGNHPELGRLSNPAIDPYVLAVGASTNAPGADGVASFSSVGNGLRNPDVVAPGAHIQGLRVPGSYIDRTYGSTGYLSPRFFRGSGTSESAAVVSGSVALLLQQQPGLSPDQVKGMLTSTARPFSGTPATSQGAGLESVSAAATAVAAAMPVQSFLRSSGKGSLELARGGKHAYKNGVVFNGESDVHGNGFLNSSANLAGLNSVLAGNEWSGNEWSGNEWSGQLWTGNEWSGNGWSGNEWSGNEWSGNEWS